MSLENLLTVRLRKVPCLRNISEDELREIVDALVIEGTLGDLERPVTSTGNIPVKFEFGPDGAFAGITAKIDGKTVNLLQGAGSSRLEVFRGPVTATNPGNGWEVDVDATVELLGQSTNQSTWTYFYARRISVLSETS